MSDKKTVSVTLPFLPLLTLLFISLKLTHYIDWSWWWVLSPFWIPLAVAAAFFAFGAGITLIGALITVIWGK